MKCPLIPTCQIFPYFVKTPMVGYWKAQYCEADFKSCARYQHTSSGKVVPLRLLPNGKMLQSSAMNKPPAK